MPAMRFRLVLATAAVSAFASLALAQPAQTFAERVEALRSASNLPGIAGVTFTSSSIGPITVSGVRKLGETTEVSANDLWHVGSISKSFTSALIAQQVERGTLKFDSTLGELLGAGVAKKFARATVAQVLSHRAGLPANPGGAEYIAILRSGDPIAVKRRRVAELALSGEPITTPGTGFLYSNVDYILLGSILEQRSGASWEDMVSDELLRPLKLSTAGFGAPGEAGTLTQPRGHRGNANGTPSPVEPGPGSDNPPLFGPAGTLHMSIADLATWGQLHLRGERGQNSVLTATTFKRLHTPMVDDYAFGWVQQAKGDDRITWHNGSNTMWYAIVAFNAATDKGVVLVTNAGGSSRIGIDALVFDYLTESSR